MNEDGKITAFPRRQPARGDILEYLSEKFECGRDYKEKEINQIIDGWHTFGDYFLLRRELIESGRLHREKDCSRYWREPKED